MSLKYITVFVIVSMNFFAMHDHSHT